MAAGITDHVRTIEEIVNLQIHFEAIQVLKNLLFRIDILPKFE